jgi:hypothetical protein
MRPLRSRLVALLSLLLAGLVVAAALSAGHGDQAPVYPVAAVQAGLARDPAAWLGRAVRVRGVAVLCVSSDSQSDPSLCSHGSTYLLDAAEANQVLPLAWAGSDPLLAVVRRVPLLGGLLPAPQVVHWAAVATYHVALRAVPGERCGVPSCFEALLLDAEP